MKSLSKNNSMLSEIKRKLQDHLQEGLLIVAGSGLSVAEGLPSMLSLAKHLITAIPKRLTSLPDSGWNMVVEKLNSGLHLEAAMESVELKPDTIHLIIDETAKIIAKAEHKALEEVFIAGRKLPFTSFIRHLFKAGKRFHLITPNYDRLIEFATENAGIGINTGFFGYLHGFSDSQKSACSHRDISQIGKKSSIKKYPCLYIHKPHGSLDWFEFDGGIIRCPLKFNRVPVIITPGTSKYRESFKTAFDEQRIAGNKAATDATRFMFIGYGFNDDHLEQYLCPNQRLNKPTVIITKDLSENAKKLISNSTGTDLIILCSVSKKDHRTRIIHSKDKELIVDEQLWNLEGFNKGVL